MEKEGLIVLSENDGRRKTYLLTNAGMEALRAESAVCAPWCATAHGSREGGTNEKRSYKLSLPRWALAQRDWYAELAARSLRVRRRAQC
ncbi:MAG: hypothetical protein ACLRRT_10910 [Ruthenibacterium lactatiformans]